MYHVVKIDEGIVDGNDLDVLVGKSSAENETTDASESERVRGKRGLLLLVIKGHPFF